MAPVLLLLLLGAPAPAAAPQAAPDEEGAPVSRPAIDAALRKELLEMGREDQLGLSGHERRLARMKEIVAQRGWPGKSLVGEDGAHAAWIVVQHFDMDLDFQRFCLEQMRLGFERGEVTAIELSFLTDRVLVHEGRPQRYGTQGAIGSPSPEEEARIDANRLAIGLEPWRVFIEKRRTYYAQQDAKKP